MKPPPFEYHAPASVDEACALLSTLEDAKVLAGGQSLVPLLNFRLARPAHIVDINRIPNLDRIYERDGGVAVQAAHADPASELPAVLLALGGHVVARSTRGERTIPAADLFTSLMQTALAADELLVEAWFPASPKQSAIAEESRRHGDFALAGAVRAGDRLALFGVAPTPVLADPKDPTKALQPSGDLEATPEFRLHLVQVLTDRVFAS